ncbi:MAG: glycosyltransferase [Rhizobiales bacterium]|nr:glycosyltransferase [Hyphomicrobiales bacterium]
MQDAATLERDTALHRSVRVAIVIPAYNEAVAIGQTIADYAAAFPEASIVVIDNNSRDGTSAAAAPFLRPGRDFLLSEPRQGKGFAIKRGLSRAMADIFIMTDGDATYPAADARRLFDHMLASRADMIVGDRRAGGTYMSQNERFGHSFGNAMLTTVISGLAGQKFNDVLSGLRIMSLPFVEALDIRSEGFQLETELNIVAAHLRADVIEVPVDYVARPAGSQSKLSTFRDGFRILTFALLNWIAFLPLQFFSVVACIGWCIAAALGYRVIAGFLESGWPYSTTAVAAASAAIVGTLSWFSGLTLKVQGRASRRRETADFLRRKREWNERLDDILL